MNGGHERGGDKSGIGQGQKVKMIMNNIKIISMLKEFRDMQALPYFWQNGAVFFITPGANGMQLAACFRITGCKEGNIIATRNQSRFPKGRNVAAACARQLVTASQCA
jgi:hypothetical protein